MTQAPLRPPTLSAMTSPAVPAVATVLVPVGSLTQHGPHLPLDTDTVIATAVAQGAAAVLNARQRGIVVAPAIAYGSSREHQDFAGTSSIDKETLSTVLVALARSMCSWAKRVVFVNAHSGNVAALTSAVAQLRVEGYDVRWVACTPAGADLHAGRAETSLMLHLHPWDVRLGRLEAGNTDALAASLPAMAEGGVKAVSPHGVLGDPRGATETEGARALAVLVKGLVLAVPR